MAIDQNTIDQAAALLHEAAPTATVILFGSYARGEPQPDSDLDFLVIEPRVASRRAEMVRLRDALRPLRVPVDIVVDSERTWRDLRDTPGTVQHEANQEGVVLHGRP